MQRELNEIEFYNYTLGQPYNIAMIITIRGNITEDALSVALKKLHDRHPLLSVKVVCDDQGIPWFYPNDNAEIPLTLVSPASPDLSLRILEKELSTPFEMAGPLPLVRATLISTPNPQLVLCMQHVICDGLSFAFLIKDLLSMLAQPDLILDPLLVTEHLAQALPAKFAKKIPKNARMFNALFFLFKIMHKIKFRKSPQNPQISSKMKDKSYQIYSWSLSPDQTSKLIARCKQERVTVHSALCTAFLFFHQLINNPVNLRTRLREPVGEAMGFFASGAPVKMKYNSARNFWDNARKYHRKLLKQMTDKNIFSIYKWVAKAVPVPRLQQFTSLFYDLVLNQLLFTITNLGDLDRLGIPSEEGEYQLESFFGGVSAGSIDAVMISIYTIRKELHFNINYYAYLAERWDFPKIASTAMDNLTHALL